MQVVVLTALKKYCSKTQQQCLFPEVMTWLLKIISRPCCVLSTELH